MKTNQDSIQDAAECLSAMPSRAGMTAIGNLMAIEQYTAKAVELGGRWLAEPKVGIRKPLALNRKAKARKAAKAAAKSRRRNRQ